jgi:hypothetical protein
VNTGPLVSTLGPFWAILLLWQNFVKFGDFFLLFAFMAKFGEIW